VLTSEAYWTSNEPAGLCGNDLTLILQGVHGPPKIDPIPNNIPCGQRITCDPDLYNRYVEIYKTGDTFACYSDDNFNTFPSKCDAENSGLFLDRDRDSIKALLCYQD